MVELQVLEAMQVQLDVVQQMLEQVAKENKIILMVTITTGPVVVAVGLTVMLAAMVELVVAVVVELKIVVQLELVVD